MAEQHFPRVSAGTVGRALDQIGPRRGRPKPSVHGPWPDKLPDKGGAVNCRARARGSATHQTLVRSVAANRYSGFGFDIELDVGNLDSRCTDAQGPRKNRYLAGHGRDRALRVSCIGNAPAGQGQCKAFQEELIG